MSNLENSGESPWRALLSVAGLCATLLLTFVRCGGLRMLTGAALGAHVFSADECASGAMLQSQGDGPVSVGGICSKDCDRTSDCGGDLRCLEGKCAPKGTSHAGDPCDAPWDCAADAPNCVVERTPFGVPGPEHGSCSATKPWDPSAY